MHSDSVDSHDSETVVSQSNAATSVVGDFLTEYDATERLLLMNQNISNIRSSRVLDPNSYRPMSLAFHGSGRSPSSNNEHSGPLLNSSDDNMQRLSSSND